MNHIDWRLIEAFIRVAREGSFTAAADALRTSQPTVSRRVSQLEEQLDLTLFARHARGLELTDAGAALMAPAEDVNRDVDSFCRRAESMTSEVGGTVRVSASEPVAVYILAPILADLLEDEPDVDLALVADNRTADLPRREADIAVRMFRPTQLDLVARRVGTVEIALYAHESYLARHPAPETIEELRDHIAVGYDRDRIGLEYLNSEAIVLTPEDFDLRTDSLAAQVEAYESRRRVSDIIGGIGYIIGLAGVVLWMKSRSRGKHGGSGAKG